MARGAAAAGQYVSGVGARAASAASQAVRSSVGPAVQKASAAAQQAGQQAAQNVQQSAQSSMGSVRSFLQNAAGSFRNFAQQILQTQVGAGSGGGSQPPGGNGPPSGNNPPAGNNPPKPKKQQTIGNTIAGQVKGIARQTIGTAVGQTVAGSLKTLGMAVKLSSPGGVVSFSAGIMKNAAVKGGEAVVWLAKLPGRLRDFGDALVKSRDHLKEYNGSIAAAVAKLEVERIGRDIRLGAMTERTGSYQTGQQSRLENNMLPMKMLKDNLTNAITGGLQNGVNVILEKLGGALSKVPVFATAAKALQDMAKEKPGSSMALNTLLHGMTYKVATQPGRFRPPIKTKPVGPPPAAGFGV